MTDRLARALPPLAAAIAVTLCSGYPLAPALAAVLVLGTVLLPHRAAFDRATQRLAGVVVIMLVIAGVRAADLPIAGVGMRAVALGIALSALGIALTRLVAASPEGGRRVDVALSLVALLACGRARPGSLYVVSIALFACAVLGSARLADPHRVALARVPRRALFLGVLVLVVAALGAGVVSAGAGPLARFVEARFQRGLVDRFESSTGFTDSVRFGRVTRLTASRAVVMRLSGPRVERLRGVVLDQYFDERWSREVPEAMQPVPVPVALDPGPDVVELRTVRADGDRVFLPLELAALASPARAVKTDSTGAARNIAGERTVVWFRVGERALLPIADARPSDLQMPASLRAPLAALAAKWTEGTSGHEEALRAIEARLLRDYTYSADYARRTNLDAVAEFLYVARHGHCEVFASAMALLARSVGIPARLVVGYRVGEQNPLFSHWVVRQANAHAWVEAEIAPGRWATFDPTPMSELPQDLPHEEAGFDAAREVLATLWSRAEDWLAERSVLELGGVAILGLVAFAVIRARRRSAGGGDEAALALAFSPPTAAYARLEAELARRGLGRARGETLESFADRLPESTIAALVRRYGELRYGGEDAGALSAALDEAARSLVRT